MLIRWNLSRPVSLPLFGVGLNRRLLGLRIASAVDSQLRRHDDRDQPARAKTYLLSHG
jgi:hypothetical protein